MDAFINFYYSNQLQAVAIDGLHVNGIRLTHVATVTKPCKHIWTFFLMSNESVYSCTKLTLKITEAVPPFAMEDHF